MSFFQRLIRQFARRREVALPDSHENNSKTVEVNVKVTDDSDSESVIFLRENTALKDDADLNHDSKPEDDTIPQADATEDNSVPSDLDSISKGYVSPYPGNISSIDDERLPRKLEAERRYSDLLSCNSESSLQDDTDKRNKNYPAARPWGRAFSPLLVEQRDSPELLTENAIPTSPSTSQPLTPAPPSTSFSTDVMNVSPTIARSEVSTNELTLKPTLPSINKLILDQAQIADQPRLPWKWSRAGTKTREHYEPTAVGKWWYVWARENRENLPLISNIGRIMETELGEQRFGAETCTRCQIEGLECWNYSANAAYQVCNPGSACARCRVEPRHYGCSLSKRRSTKRKTSPPPPPPPRLLLPKVGYGGYPPVHMGPGAPAVQADKSIHPTK